MGETRLTNRDRVIRRRMSQSSDSPFSPLLLEMDVRSTVDVFFFSSSSSILCLFCYFLPTVANGTVGKKKCAGDAINVYIT